MRARREERARIRQAGQLWYGDFTFPHRLQNAGTESRVHLVIDLMNNAELKRMLPDSLIAQREVRSRARERCKQLMSGWNKVFATELRLARTKSQRPA